jgi:hypothetical protein
MLRQVYWGDCSWQGGHWVVLIGSMVFKQPVTVHAPKSFSPSDSLSARNCALIVGCARYNSSVARVTLPSRATVQKYKSEEISFLRRLLTPALLHDSFCRGRILRQRRCRANRAPLVNSCSSHTKVTPITSPMPRTTARSRVAALQRRWQRMIALIHCCGGVFSTSYTTAPLSSSHL